MIEAKLEKSEIEKLQTFFNATQKQLNNASNYALRETINWVKSQLVKRTANESHIQQKPLTQKTSRGTARIHSSVDKANKTARLWFGTYKISLARLNPRQLGKGGSKKRKGARAGVVAGVGGSIFREGAFLMPIRKKTGEAAIVPYQVMKRASKKRLPIIKQTYDYSDKAVGIENELMSQVPKKLADTLRAKLKWQTEQN